MDDKKSTPKQDVCTEPAYLFWKMQSRLSKLTTQLTQIEKTVKTTNEAQTDSPTKNHTR